MNCFIYAISISRTKRNIKRVSVIFFPVIIGNDRVVRDKCMGSPCAEPFSKLVVTARQWPPLRSFPSQSVRMKNNFPPKYSKQQAEWCVCRIYEIDNIDLLPKHMNRRQKGVQETFHGLDPRYRYVDKIYPLIIGGPRIVISAPAINDNFRRTVFHEPQGKLFEKGFVSPVTRWDPARTEECNSHNIEPALQ